VYKDDAVCKYFPPIASIHKKNLLQLLKNSTKDDPNMKLPRGFGKNYFSLNAITATVNQVSIDAITTRVHNFHILSFDTDELEVELEEEELATLCPLQFSTKPCHCNCYFFKFTRKTLKFHHFQNYFFNYFKMLNNSISPP
jgi:hypothetical protein